MELTQEQMQDIVLRTDIIPMIIEQEERFQAAALEALFRIIESQQKQADDEEEDEGSESSYSYYDDDSIEEDNTAAGPQPGPAALSVEARVSAPEPITRKRGPPRDETPCPPPRGDSHQTQPPAKRLRTDAPSAPAPAPASRSNAARFSRLLAPLITFSSPTLESTVDKEVFAKAPVQVQMYLKRMDFSAVGAVDLATALIDFGDRMRHVTDQEMAIGISKLASTPNTPVMWNAMSARLRHAFFWRWVEEATGKKRPAYVEVKKEVVQPTMPTTTTRVIRPVEVRTKGNLREHLVKQIDEKSKGPLKEKVQKWLDGVTGP